MSLDDTASAQLVTDTLAKMLREGVIGTDPDLQATLDAAIKAVLANETIKKMHLTYFHHGVPPM